MYIILKSCSLNKAFKRFIRNTLGLSWELMEMLKDQTTRSFIQVELAAVFDAGKAFVKATYTLKGDYSSALNAGIQVGHYPICWPLLSQCHQDHIQYSSIGLITVNSEYDPASNIFWTNSPKS